MNQGWGNNILDLPFSKKAVSQKRNGATEGI